MRVLRVQYAQLMRLTRQVSREELNRFVRVITVNHALCVITLTIRSD